MGSQTRSNRSQSRKAVIDGDSPLFPLGSVYATHGAIDLLEQLSLNLAHFLIRHVSGDWGQLSEEDWQANLEALEHGARIFSSYKLSDDQKLWIITEADRSATTLLLPEEY